VWRASPLERAVETARLLGVTEPAIDHRLVETDWGEWEGRTLSEIRAATDGEVFDREARGLSFRAPCGESPKDVQARLRPFLIEAGGSEQPVVVVTHNGVIRALFSLALDWDMMSAMPVRLDRHCFHFFDVSAAGAVRTLGINTPLRNVTS
jgi:probable phosphoglycerate mutase